MWALVNCCKNRLHVRAFMTRLNGGFRIQRWVEDVCEAKATSCTVREINTNTLAVVFLRVLTLVNTGAWRMMQEDCRRIISSLTLSSLSLFLTLRPLFHSTSCSIKYFRTLILYFVSLKGQFAQNWKLFYHLLTLVSFQTHATGLLLCYNKCPLGLLQCSQIQCVVKH